MDIQKFMSLSVDKQGVKTLLDLPFPPEISLSEALSEDLYALAEKFYELWAQVVFASDEFPCVAQDANAAWGKTNQLIGAYYDFILVELLKRDYIGKNASNIPAPQFGTLKKLFEDNTEKKLDEEAPLTQGDLDLFRAQALFVNYITFRMLSLAYSYFKPVSYFAARFGEMTLDSTILMLRLLVSSDIEEDQISFLACQLLASALEYLKEMYKSKAQSTPWIWNKEHKTGVFSSINLPELALLASRAPNMVAKYGEKAIERRFEAQINLVMQTLGFYVVPTTPGSKTVDLICLPIHASSEEAYSFLVEAKTTGQDYSLPAKDSRAIQEYVMDARMNLRNLPPLKFVLVVGPSPTDSITRKFQSLESSVGLPVRYCHAQILANLREGLQGPVPSEIFLDQVLSSPFVLCDDFSSPIIEAYNDLQQSHIDFVKNLFSIRGKFRK